MVSRLWTSKYVYIHIYIYMSIYISKVSSDKGIYTEVLGILAVEWIRTLIISDYLPQQIKPLQGDAILSILL